MLSALSGRKAVLCVFTDCLAGEEAHDRHDDLWSDTPTQGNQDSNLARIRSSDSRTWFVPPRQVVPSSVWGAPVCCTVCLSCSFGRGAGVSQLCTHSVLLSGVFARRKEPGGGGCKLHAGWDCWDARMPLLGGSLLVAPCLLLWEQKALHHSLPSLARGFCRLFLCRRNETSTDSFGGFFTTTGKEKEESQFFF
jgi:hypothetical protein